VDLHINVRIRTSRADSHASEPWRATDRQLFLAELDLALAQRDELAGFVSLYKALGGGR
jgi:hypothetical protein